MSDEPQVPSTQADAISTGRPQTESALSKVDNQWLDGYLDSLRKTIEIEARDIGSGRRGGPNGLDVAEAARRYAPGQKFPAEPTFSQRLAGQLSGITFVCAILAVVFGGIAYFLPDQRAACFDIIKIFAGAIVGSTGATVVTASRRR